MDINIYVAAIGLAGVIAGSSITAFINYLNGKNELKMFEKKLEQKNKDQLRDFKINQLYFVLIPIIEIYQQNDLARQIMYQHDAHKLGNGLQDEKIIDLKKVIQNNKRYMPIELIKLFHQVNCDYKDHISFTKIDEKVNRYRNQQNENTHIFLFDEDRIFIKQIEKEANKIENTYNN